MLLIAMTRTAVRGKAYAFDDIFFVESVHIIASFFDLFARLENIICRSKKRPRISICKNAPDSILGF